MDTFLEILKYILPSLVVLWVTYIVLQRMMNQDMARREFELRKEHFKQMSPLRLTAYERLVLLLERTKPESILHRVSFSGMDVITLQTMLLQQLREEFEHNTAQQVYVSDEAWLRVKVAKESLAQLINSCASGLQPHDSALLLAQSLIATYSQSAQTPSEEAIDFLKREVRQLY